MNTRKKKRDPIPEHFATLEEAATFWATHDLSDYWDLTEEVEIEVDPITALRGCGEGVGLMEKLLAERREDRRRDR